MLYDKQRLAVMEQTNENERTFQEQNLFMARATQQVNQELEADRKQRESDNKTQDQIQDQQELAWTNATELRYSEKKSFSDKFLK